MLGVPGNNEFTTWSMAGSMSFRAPMGQIGDIVNGAVVVRTSLWPTMPWRQMQARHQAKIMQISHEIALDDLRTAANISRISSRSNADILEP